MGSIVGSLIVSLVKRMCSPSHGDVKHLAAFGN
jgi:hypothetical protein